MLKLCKHIDAVHIDDFVQKIKEKKTKPKIQTIKINQFDPSKKTKITEARNMENSFLFDHPGLEKTGNFQMNLLDYYYYKHIRTFYTTRITPL